MEAHEEVLTPEEDRARRELAEFRGRYPEVSLTREELLRLAPDMVGENPKPSQRHTKPGRRRKRTGRLPS